MSWENMPINSLMNKRFRYNLLDRMVSLQNSYVEVLIPDVIEFGKFYKNN